MGNGNGPARKIPDNGGRKWKMAPGLKWPFKWNNGPKHVFGRSAASQIINVRSVGGPRNT